jgi:hypothetical protein
MTRLVREFVEVADPSSLDEVINTLVALRQSLPAGGDATLRMQGDEVFGRRLSISYLRPQTAEEAECDARYGDAYRQSQEQQLAELQAKLAIHCEDEPALSLAA